MLSTEKDIYRLVPYRFFFNEISADKCKLEKLTNLFPEMKAIIELESFKFNNLNRMIERLSQIYSVSTVIDKRDDTCHVFLGPYHLSLGPAIFSAIHFKNISIALLSSSHIDTTNDHTNQHKNRRHEAILRRFRRAVRKLILIKSIIDKLRLASILTPYNQYELYTRGIYDLVLAGHLHNGNSNLTDDSFIQQVNEFRSMDKSERETLVASKYMKISALLHLISPTPSLHQADNNRTIGNEHQPLSDTSNSYLMNENQSESLTEPMCCPQHCQEESLIRFPVRRSISHQSSQFVATESRSRLNTNPSTRRKSSVVLGKNTTASLPDLTTDIPSSSLIPPPFDLSDSEPKKSSIIPSSTNPEDALINNISTLLTNYLSSRQSTTSSESSTANDTDEFDKLLVTIKTLVDDKLALKTSNNSSVADQNLYSKPTRTSTRNRSRKLLTHHRTSLQQTSLDDFDEEQSSIKNKLDISSKLQSYNEIGLGELQK
ncbi:hypothetical protein I4U23_014499 [Adineta vaga]|nr:hypothetical protein I4U23_014499 [Adineta vaga]